jgi:hypothetical protein
MYKIFRGCFKEVNTNVLKNIVDVLVLYTFI